MKDKHIIDLLEKGPLASLDESERAVIESHAVSCEDCQRALEATYLSTALLKECSAETFAPSPFFETRVLTALRERQATGEPWALSRLWRAAGALVSSMAAAVAALAVFSFAIPSGETAINANVASAFNSNSADEAIFDQNELPDEQISDGQILTTLYEEEEAAK